MEKHNPTSFLPFLRVRAMQGCTLVATKQEMFSKQNLDSIYCEFTLRSHLSLVEGFPLPITFWKRPGRHSLKTCGILRQQPVHGNKQLNYLYLRIFPFPLKDNHSLYSNWDTQVCTWTCVYAHQCTRTALSPLYTHWNMAVVSSTMVYA